jgi:hypothetical protein
MQLLLSYYNSVYSSSLRDGALIAPHFIDAVRCRLNAIFDDAKVASSLPYYYSSSISSSVAWSSWPTFTAASASSAGVASSTSSTSMGVLWPPVARSLLLSERTRAILFGAWLQWRQLPSSHMWQLTILPRLRPLLPPSPSQITQAVATGNRSVTVIGSSVRISPPPPVAPLPQSPTLTLSQRTRLIPLLALSCPALPMPSLSLLLQCL